MDFIFTIILAFVVVITIYTIIKVRNKLAMKDIDCKKSMIGNKEYRLAEAKFLENSTLKDYFVMTAYNCCSVKEDWVDLCALSHCIISGCRCLDFEIFEHDGMAVVGTTSMKNGNIRDSYNYIKLSNVLSKILEEGFSLKYTNLYKDPLIVNLRIKTISEDFYNKVDDVIKKSKVNNSNRYLEELKNQELLDTDIKNLKRKIIYMTSDINYGVLNGSSLGDSINLTGERASSTLISSCGSNNISLNSSSSLFQVNNTNLMDREESINDLKDVSMDNYLKISIPDDIKINPNYCYHKKAKINFIGMSFREKIPKDYSLNPWVNTKSDYKDDLLKLEKLGNLNNYIQWFNNNNSAFINIDKDKHRKFTDDYTNSCDSNVMFEHSVTIVNKEDNTKTKIRKYWYNNIMGKLI